MSAKNISIIPNPLHIDEIPGRFVIKPETVIKVSKGVGRSR